MDEALKSSGAPVSPPPAAARAPAADPAPPAVRLPRAKGRGRRRLGRRILESPAVQASVAGLATGHLRLVSRTSRFSFDPADPYASYAHLAPVIFTMWHGQHFMLPFARIFEFDVRVLISRHRDGEINARVAEKLGIRTIRGSTARDPSRMIEKGGMVGFLEMKAALEEGACVSMTADISNLAARRAGLGIVSLARVSGRPIIPLAITTSRRIDLKSWDRATINLPFSRAVCAVAAPITVPADADGDMQEAKRREVEDSLNEATIRARRLADRHG
ncbi:MAG TPA: lysophospholipid acyltransferase family protein [Bauldia sp.]|nr:lysophospholipid acyltransferase family protein [Bauldia sp.]